MTCYTGAFGAQGPWPDMSADMGKAMQDAMRGARARWLMMAAHRGGHGVPFNPEMAFGPWAGPRRGRGPRGGEGRRAGRGDVRLAILALLAEEPKHGYQLIQEIADRSEGAWNPSPGSVYPALSALQDEGLIDDEKLDGRRVFSLTAAGREYVAANPEALAKVFAANSPSPEHEEFTDMRQLMFGVGAAALNVMQGGTESQREQAREVLNRARRDLYRILAEEPPTAG